MAFIYEIIPEEQKDKFTFPVQVSRNGRKPTLYKWVIDHKNDFYLVKASKSGGAYDGTTERNTFYFHAYNEDTYIKATPLNLESKGDKGWLFRWEINELSIPNQLKEKSEVIIALIVEAFTLWAQQNDGACFDMIEVKLMCDVDIVCDKEVKQ